MKIVIPGGTGQIGGILCRALLAGGHEVVVLSRVAGSTHGVPCVPWDGRALGDWACHVDGADAVINLAGRSVNCRYNAANRRAMMDSRVDSTRALGEAIAAAAHPPRVWLNSSTATIYRHTLDAPNDEATGVLGGAETGAPRKWDFSIEVAKAWEKALLDAPTPATRKVALRSAMVMSPDRGGVFDVMLGMVRLGLGGTNGSGRQWVSWVHDADFVAAVKLLLGREDLEGAVNICSPQPLPNAAFLREIRRAWGMPVGLPAMAWMMEVGALFLRTETELVLKSRRVLPGRLLEAGFNFQFPGWPEAVGDIVHRVKAGEGR